MPYQSQSNTRRAVTEREYYAATYGRVPGALWSDVPLGRGHLQGIPYSYYDDEIVMIRARTAALIERMKAEAVEEARRQRNGRRRGGGGDEDWQHEESGWIGTDE